VSNFPQALKHFFKSAVNLIGGQLFYKDKQTIMTPKTESGRDNALFLVMRLGQCGVVCNALAFGSTGHGFKSRPPLFSYHSASAFTSRDHCRSVLRTWLSLLPAVVHSAGYPLGLYYGGVDTTGQKKLIVLISFIHFKINFLSVRSEDRNNIKRIWTRWAYHWTKSTD